MSEIKDYAIKCFQDEAQAILDLIPLLTDDFDKAIDLIYHSRGKLVVTGVGKSGHCGAKIAATLASTGTPSFFINPLDAFHITRLFKTIIWKQSLYHACLLMLPITPTFPFSFL